MLAPDADSRSEILAFRSSLIDDVYAPRDFLPWRDIEKEVEQSAPGLSKLEDLASLQPEDPEALADALVNEPTVYRVVLRLLSASGGVGFGDGRRLPDQWPRDPEVARATAHLLLDLGLGRLIRTRGDLADLLRVALIGADARRRGFRRRDTLATRMDELIGRALEEAGAILGRPVLSESDTRDLPSFASRRVSRVLYSDRRPFAALATVFEAITGGRQFANFREFIRVQDELDEVPIALVVIADGRGVRALPPTLVEEVWDRVGGIVSISQAENGALSSVIADVAGSGGAPRSWNLPVERLIASMLAAQESARAADLPVSPQAARLALARYEAEHPESALELDARGERLTWRRADAVSRADSLRRRFDPIAAVSLLARLIAANQEPELQIEARPYVVVDPAPNPLLPRRLYISGQDRAPDEGDIRDTSRVSRQKSPDASISVLVVPESGSWLDDPERELTMRTTATSVVVLDPEALRGIASSSRPVHEALAAHVMQQADLTKASPFVHNGVTPARVFAGRGSDEASIAAHTGSSSVALLGSRRIGKTSLMRRVEERLAAESRTVYYGDCQAIGDWTGFARLARRTWNVSLGRSFVPDELAELAEQLRDGGDPPVLILDEVDRLIDWDQRNSIDGVNEAFFRACRALSQANEAQFVFSGERAFADRLWSPNSPHWNFCQRHILRQLDRGSAASLLIDVLAFLSIEFDDQTLAEETLWQATSGHPRLVQLIGDTMVRRLNERPRDSRSLLTVDELRSVINSFEYKREYVETYWGQARPHERRLGKAIAMGARSTAELRETDVAREGLGYALRVLELYGIIDIRGEDVTLRAEYLPVAIESVEPGLDE